MLKLIILLIIVAQMCFASPFDLADEYDNKVNDSTKNIDVQPQAVNTPKDDVDAVQPVMSKKQSLIESKRAKIVAIDIKTGNKKEFAITTGDSIKVDKINLQLKNCLIEDDNCYNKISLAELSVNGKNLKFSNDANLGNMQIGNKLLVVDCNHK